MDTTPRKPLFLFQLSGLFLLRTAQRALLRLLWKAPPRTTRVLWVHPPQTETQLASLVMRFIKNGSPVFDGKYVEI
ncbi:MAG: hypothetical protein Fur0022_25230 [Anaerolineales bacterium]